MIKIDGLVKSYGHLPVLRGVDLHIEAGEFVTLVGANGAGKTTLLRVVATLLRPTAGKVSIGGWPLPTHVEKVGATSASSPTTPCSTAIRGAAENLTSLPVSLAWTGAKSGWNQR